MNTGAVIVTYHTHSDTLRACLQSLVDNHISDIVVVDNERDPVIKKITQEKGINYLPQSQNLGFATAANIGAVKLTNKYLLFINPDAVLSHQSCANAEEYLNNNSKVGVVGFMLRTPSGQVQPHSFGAAVTPASLLTRRFSQAELKDRPTDVGWVSGGAMMIRRHLFVQIKGFDPSFFLYWEDVDLCRRAKLLGQRVVIIPFATAVHHRGASLSSNKLKTKLYDKSAGIYFCKHYSKTICFLQKFCRYLYRFISPQVD